MNKTILQNQLAVAKAKKALSEFDKQKMADRAVLQNALIDAQAVIENEKLADTIATLESQIASVDAVAEPINP